MATTSKRRNNTSRKNTNKKSNTKKKNNNSKNKSKKKSNSKILIITIVSISIIVLAILLILFINRDNSDPVNNTIDYNKSNINVLLTNGDSKTWDSIVISCDKGMTWNENGTGHSATNGEDITFSNQRPTGTVIEILPNDVNGRFVLKGNSKKGDSYPGRIQLHYTSQGLQVTNYIPLEEYIKGVICSEMPVNYGVEALKAQAVCARSYVLCRNGKLAYEEAQADVDDTVSFQVYGEKWASGDAITAVDETSGMVVYTPDHEIANTLFYSTSCGYTQTQKSEEFPYVTRKYVSLENRDPIKEMGASVNNVIINRDESFEKAFAEYIKEPDDKALEKSDPYFRWDVVVDIKANKDKVINSIIDIYNSSNGKKVQVDSRLASKALNQSTNTLKNDGFGEYRNMEVLKRSSGGAITSLSMEFTNGCAIINDELAIRRILGQAAKTAKMADGSSKNVTTLFSSAFTFVANENGAHLYGGGFGHGCGMSQDAARRMSDAGWNCNQIIQFFYEGCSVGKL